jgi:hypothetical protein
MTVDLFVYAIFVLFVSSAWDFPALVFTGEIIPNPPASTDLYEPGSWYHLGKNFWTELIDADPEWWSKLARFVIWWWLCLKLVRLGASKFNQRSRL